MPEFLEVWQTLCTATTIGLAAALRYQQEKSTWRSPTAPVPLPVPLSEQIASILKPTQLALVGTERSMARPLHNLFVRAAAALSQIPCSHSRLTYTADRLSLEAIVAGDVATADIMTVFGTVQLEAVCQGGTLEIQPRADRSMLR